MLEDLMLIGGRGASGALVALLLCGHALGDFAFQTRAMVRRKREIKFLIFHIAIVALIHLAVLLPFFPAWELAAAILIIAGTHLIIDHARTRFEHEASVRPGWDLRLFILDQSLHLLILLAAWWFLAPSASAWFNPLFDVTVDPVVEGAILVAAGAFLWNGGNAIVRGTLDVVELRYRSATPEGDAVNVEEGDRVGELIGKLERLFIFALALVGAWAVVGLYVGTKPFARLKMSGAEENAQDLKLNRDYYLVGTLTSALVAILILLFVWAMV